MENSKERSHELLGGMASDLHDVINRFIFELVDAINKKEISKAQDIAEIIEADLKQLDEDLTDVCKILNVAEKYKRSPIRRIRGSHDN